MVGQSRRCKLWRGEVWRVWSGLGSRGGACLGVAVLGKLGPGSHGLLRLVMASLVKTRLGKAVGVLHVEARCSMSRQIVEWRVMLRQSCLGSASRVVAWQSRQVPTRQGESSFGAARQSRHGNHQLSERRQYASIYKQVFISQWI